MKKKIRSFLINILLLVSGAFLFAFSNPGFIFPEGISFFAWFAYVPVFVLIYRASLKSVWLYGFVYGVISYMLYVSWLVTFSPAGSLAIEIQYGLMLLVVFTCMKLCMIFFPKKGWIASFVIFCAYEYLKTVGFAGFSYGVTAYTQWKNLVLMQCSELAGVWPLSALVVFPSVWFSSVILRFTESAETESSGNAENTENESADRDTAVDSSGRVNGGCCVKSFLRPVKSHGISACVWLCFFSAAVLYGCLSRKDYSAMPSVKVTAIQHNTDPWLSNDSDDYAEDVNNLIDLSQKALSQDADIKLVVWPETSVIPPVIKHYKLRPDRNRFNIVKKFLEFVEEQRAVFVVGNDHQDDIYEDDPDDYNSVLVFVPGKNVLPPNPEIYRKIRLVPFTENFPWPKQFPRLYEALLAGDTHLWSKGEEYTVFREAGLAFSTPVCFEDTFGETGRNMFNAGARALVNLSNDAWSKSLSCQNQHLAMARFRCIENRIPAVRSTASGQTCIIDPNGIIRAMAPPFEKTFVTGEIPVIPDDATPTLYCRIGDLVGAAFATAAFCVLTVGFILYILRRKFKLNV
ncbi:apolipoprotein N-acyltransferase [Treponema parvum]|uniref:Apolipoprotein N-acyltransferase n=1 Tax=Treponema parvum TaxID=138851 RepID=A0A975IEV2_9SPIR|nr:apolipoprotein N-acyltransferase [Treponema parvum]QTQ13679.1 apolipoprotein N-acyltransferase [Treponema parvum]